MKLIKINTDHYVVVNDSEIQEGDWFLPISGIGWELNKPRQAYSSGGYTNGHCRKITHSTQPLDERGYWGKVMPLTLTISEIKELIGEVDVEKKVEEVYPQTYYSGIHIDGFLKAGYVKGYNQALEDNKEKKYTEEDVISIVEKSRETGLTAEYLMLTLQPKTQWEVELVDGKLKLK